LKGKNSSSYLFFQNITQVNGFKGFVGYSIKELSLNENNLYCSNQNLFQNLPPLTDSNGSFTSDFMIRSYSSGCYYYDLNTGKWSSDGMDIYEDTNLSQTHCVSSHLTSFAGGLVLLPSIINFQYAFSNASSIQNPLIYYSLIFLTCLYILFATWAKWKDFKDLDKINIIFLEDNYPADNYFYELIVFTGDKDECETNSKVRKFRGFIDCLF
jgi:hypothetical protein